MNPRGTSEGLSFEDPFRDYISANRIKMRGRESPDPLLRRDLYGDSSMSLQAPSLKQEAPCDSGGCSSPH